MVLRVRRPPGLIPAAERRIWLCMAPTDIRRSFDGLAALARNHLGEDGTGGDRFVFVNRKGTIVKVLPFDGGGYWVWATRLENALLAERLETLAADHAALQRTVSGLRETAALLKDPSRGFPPVVFCLLMRHPTCSRNFRGSSRGERSWSCGHTACT